MSETRAALLSYGLLAEFSDSDALLEAARTARAQGYSKMEAYTPHPNEEIFHELGHRNHLPAVVLLGGALGALTGFGLQYYTAVVSYPVRVGGKPFNSWPSFIVVTFELTILFASLAAVLGMFALNRLPQPYHPVFNVPLFELASRDRYFLLIRSSDPLYEEEATERFLQSLSPLEIAPVPR